MRSHSRRSTLGPSALRQLLSVDLDLWEVFAQHQLSLTKSLGTCVTGVSRAAPPLAAAGKVDLSVTV